MGSQEVHVIDMVKSITKYAVQILDPKEIKYHLEKAYYEATTGRMGPVWLDIPLDVQAAMINEEKLIGYKEQNGYKCNFNIETEVKEVVELFKYSRKPLILAGNGIKLSNAEQEFYKFIDKLQVPVQTTWKTVDLIEENHPLYAGHPGIMGDRGANFVLQSCDLLIILGSRLDTSITAFNHANFGINAKKIMVDIDEHEIDKMKIDIKVKVVSNVKDFILKLNSKTDEIVKK